MILGVSNGLLTFNIVIIVLLIAWGLTWLFQYYRRKKYATVLDQDAFHEGMRKAQVIDLRQPNDFKKGHKNRFEVDDFLIAIFLEKQHPFIEVLLFVGIYATVRYD